MTFERQESVMDTPVCEQANNLNETGVEKLCRDIFDQAMDRLKLVTGKSIAVDAVNCAVRMILELGPK